MHEVGCVIIKMYFSRKKNQKAIKKEHADHGFFFSFEKVMSDYYTNMIWNGEVLVRLASN